jgi:hypothetical protein
LLFLVLQFFLLLGSARVCKVFFLEACLTKYFFVFNNMFLCFVKPQLYLDTFPNFFYALCLFFIPLFSFVGHFFGFINALLV